ncbi:hypothetical protein ACSOV5_05655 [Faecalibacterium prausnitzii]|uniref:hypothetical protein n=1 Tax=Faecalibacterium prausnitzii TaxID=853 RepID=UPI0029133CEB|nr:hypothetical protein [Faecalibacterium prausnitzii]MDU8656432.1 hypothetical protein [Faecalibacterium prausnitzii]
MDGSKIFLVEPPCRFKPTAFQQRIGDADGGSGLELHLHPGFIIIHQQRTVNDVENVAAVVVPIGIHQLARQVRNLLAEPFMVNAVLSGNHFRHRLHQIGAELPHLRVTGIAAHPGVAHIKDIVQTRHTAGLV